MNKDIKEIREYIACPQFGDDHYGKWGALRLDQRRKIKALLDYITNLEKENKRLNNTLNEIEAIVYADISNIDCIISIQEKLDKLKERDIFYGNI